MQPGIARASVGAGKRGLTIVPSGAVIVERAQDAPVVRHVVVRLGVEQDRADDGVHGGGDGALEWHVERQVVELRGAPREIDLELVAAHAQRHDDAQVLVAR